MSNGRIIVQCDWDATVREKDAKAWVGFKTAADQESKYSELRVRRSGDCNVPNFTTSDGFAVTLNKRCLKVSYDDGGRVHECQFSAPLSAFTHVHQPKKNVFCLDVTPGGLGVSCDSQSNLLVWTTDNGEVRRRLEGHFGDVYSCRFFPSGVVVLSGGADLQLKIWSAETGKCCATLRGHRAGITDTAIVERGRNVVSVSRDGTARLWDCGQSACLATFDDVGGGIINACAIGTPVQDGVNLGVSDTTTGDREVMTEGKLMLLACEAGSLQAYGLHSRKKVFDMPCGDAVNCCTFLSDTCIACGTQDSRILFHDIRNVSSPLAVLTETRSAILSLLPYKDGCFVTTHDGSCFYIDDKFRTVLEMTGPDCDPVYKVSSSGCHLFTCCRDGVIRKYALPTSTNTAGE